MTDRPIACNFCGKTQRDVKQLIAGPACYICNECVGLCADIVASQQDDGKTHEARVAGFATKEELGTLRKELHHLVRRLETKLGGWQHF